MSPTLRCNCQYFQCGQHKTNTWHYKWIYTAMVFFWYFGILVLHFKCLFFFIVASRHLFEKKEWCPPPNASCLLLFLKFLWSVDIKNRRHVKFILEFVYTENFGSNNNQELKHCKKALPFFTKNTQCCLNSGWFDSHNAIANLREA